MKHIPTYIIVNASAKPLRHIENKRRLIAIPANGNQCANTHSPEEIRSMIYGLDTLVQHGSGKMSPAINLDNAATTPPFKAVAEEIQRQLLYYGSIGRGTGQKSKHSSITYTEGRDTVLDFVGANSSRYTVFYAGSTTDGMNKLASALTNPRDRDGNPRNEDILIISTRMEHHANDLPWRERAHTVYAEVDDDGRLIIDDIERFLKMEDYKDKVKYVTVTAASNVTGYVNDVHKIARIAHKYGAKIIVDGAQIVAHRRFSMLGRKGKNEDIDFFVFSAHKMYSPYGGGAVVGLKDVLNDRMPQYYGGGMVITVSDNTVTYGDEPDLYEAGSPNVPAVVGMIKAMEILKEIGFDYIAEHEQRLLRKALDGLRVVDNGENKVILYGDNEYIADRVGILVFKLKDWNNEDVAEYLAAHAGIAVRHAAFCSHPYVRRLEQFPSEPLGGPCKPPAGMVRVSFGIYSTEEDVDILIHTIKEMIEQPIVFAKGEAAVFARGLTRLPNDRG